MGTAEDLQDIQNLLVDYCLAADECRFEDWADLFGEDEKPPPPPKVVEVVVKSDPRTRFVDKPLAPWTGTIGGQRGSVRIGMTDGQVVEQFGQGTVEELYNDKPYRKRIYYEDPAGTGIMREAGGVALTVFIDLDSETVFGFIPPQPLPQPSP